MCIVTQGHRHEYNGGIGARLIVSFMLDHTRALLTHAQSDAGLDSALASNLKKVKIVLLTAGESFRAEFLFAFLSLQYRHVDFVLTNGWDVPVNTRLHQVRQLPTLLLFKEDRTQPVVRVSGQSALETSTVTGIVERHQYFDIPYLHGPQVVSSVRGGLVILIMHYASSSDINKRGTFPYSIRKAVADVKARITAAVDILAVDCDTQPSLCSSLLGSCGANTVSVCWVKGLASSQPSYKCFEAIDGESDHDNQPKIVAKLRTWLTGSDAYSPVSIAIVDEYAESVMWLTIERGWDAITRLFFSALSSPMVHVVLTAAIIIVFTQLLRIVDEDATADATVTRNNE